MCHLQLLEDDDDDDGLLSGFSIEREQDWYEVWPGINL